MSEHGPIEILRPDINALTKEWVREQSKDFERQRIERLEDQRERELRGTADNLYFVIRNQAPGVVQATCISGLPRQITGIEAYGRDEGEALCEARFNFRRALVASGLERTDDAASVRGAEARLHVADRE